VTTVGYSGIAIPDSGRRKSMRATTLIKRTNDILAFVPLFLVVGCVAASMPARPNLVKAIISCELSMISPEGVSVGLKPADLIVLARVPIVLQVGDYDPPRLKSLKSFATSIGANVSVLSLPELGIYGNSHLMMIEKNNLQVADLLIQQLEKIIPENVQ
jgi:hypothetical protein